MSNPAQILFIGLPGSGKTTFLAALWHVLEERSATTLTLDLLSDDRTYLNQIANDWRECVQVQRTKLEPEETVVLHLNGEELGAFDLTVPDLSGEAFEALLTDRRMLVRHDELVHRATGVILFVHPDVQKSPQLTQALRMEAAISAAVEGRDSSDGNASAVEPWTIEKLPTQVKLIDLLQFLLDRAPGTVRLAMVVSAWDLVERLGTPPTDYVSREMPMLGQFLEANGDLLEHAVFGVSAQGGDITVAEHRNALLELDASERIRVHQGDEVSHDITKPIAWLLGTK